MNQVRMLVKDLRKNINLEDFTLIVPSISVGNTGQLAIDCSIHHFNATKIYQFWHRGVLPVIGQNPFDENSSTLGLAAEIFAVESLKLVFFQIRSAIVKNSETEFLNSAIDFFKNHNVKQIIILSSSYAQNRLDAQLTDSQVRYVACPVMSKNYKSEFDELTWKLLEQYDEKKNSICLSGAGFVSKVFKICQSKEMPCLILLKFCSDGDNIPDALDLISFLDSWLHIYPRREHNDNLKTPPSWKFLFGNSGPQEIY